MQAQNWQKAIFIDRDGVINHDPGDYTTSVEAFEILPGVLEKLKEWKEQGYLLIVITNQAGIAKGLYTSETLNAIHAYLQGMCLRHGFVLDAIHHCPHHENFTGRCLCRKPGSLLIEKALHRFQLSPEHCVMIGDKQRDIDAAAGAGVKGVLIETNAGLNQISLNEFIA